MSDSEKPQFFLLGLKPEISSAHLPTEVVSRKCGANTGNLVVSFALCRQLGFPEVLDVSAGPRQLNRSGRSGLVQGANQLGVHFKGGRWFHPIGEIDIALAIVGVGIQAQLIQSRHSGQWTASPKVDIPVAALDWLGRIAERAPTAAPNIGVRGSLTEEALAECGFVEGVEVVGCPSLFINPNPLLGAAIAANAGAPERIAVLAGNTAWSELQPAEARLARLVGKTSGSYIGQHGTGMMEVTRGEAERLAKEDLRRCRDYICPNMSLDRFKAWCNAHGNLFFSVPAWLEHYRRFDLVVGARLHGVMLALQAGVPALCIAHDARVLELCRTMHVPHVLPAQVGRGISLKRLAELAAFDADEFDANRRALCGKYVNFLHSNGVTPVQWLKDLAVSGPARTQR